MSHTHTLTHSRTHGETDARFTSLFLGFRSQTVRWGPARGCCDTRAATCWVLFQTRSSQQLCADTEKGVEDRWRRTEKRTALLRDRRRLSMQGERARGVQSGGATADLVSAWAESAGQATYCRCAARLLLRHSGSDGAASRWHVARGLGAGTWRHRDWECSQARAASSFVELSRVESRT